MIDPRIILSVATVICVLSYYTKEVSLLISVSFIVVASIVLTIIMKRLKNNGEVVFEIAMVTMVAVSSLLVLGPLPTMCVLFTYLALTLVEAETEGSKTTRPLESAMILMAGIAITKSQNHNVLAILLLLVLPYVTGAIRRSTEENDGDNDEYDIIEKMAKLSSVIKLSN